MFKQFGDTVLAIGKITYIKLHYQFSWETEEDKRGELQEYFVSLGDDEVHFRAGTPAFIEFQIWLNEQVAK